jgi:hypothetical protein
MIHSQAFLHIDALMLGIMMHLPFYMSSHWWREFESKLEDL